MSKNKSLTRLVAVVSEHNFPLVSIRENSSGSLILKPKRAIYAIYDGIRRKTLEQKLTVHTPSERGNVTVHHTIRMIDGPDREMHHVTSALSDGGIQMIYSHTFGDLSLGPPTQLIRDKDRAITISRYDPKRSALHMILFIGGPQLTIDAIEEGDNYDRWVVNFGMFSVLAVTGYSFLISPNEGWLTHVGTAPATIGGIRQGEPFGISPGLSPAQAKIIASSQLLMCHAQSFERTIDFLMQRDPAQVTKDAFEFEPFLQKCFDFGVQRNPYGFAELA